MATNTSATLSPMVNTYAVRKFLRRAQPGLVTERFGQKDNQPKNKGKVRKYRRYEALPVAIAPLSEGVTPEADMLTLTDVEVTLEQFGSWVKITDVIADTHEDPVLNETVKLCGEQAAAVVEKVRISRLKAGTNVFFANGVASRDAVITTVKPTDLKLVERTFNRHGAKTISQIIKATPNVATEPVPPAYFAMCHTDLRDDLYAIAGFTRVENYGSAEKAIEHEIGRYGSIRFVCPPMLFEPWLAAGAATSSAFLSNGVDPSGNAACDVYPIIIVARDAYGIVPLQGMGAAQITVMNPNQPDKADPLNQWGLVSWKIYQAIVILNQMFMARIECACTAVPAVAA